MGEAGWGFSDLCNADKCVQEKDVSFFKLLVVTDHCYKGRSHAPTENSVSFLFDCCKYINS